MQPNRFIWPNVGILVIICPLVGAACNGHAETESDSRLLRQAVEQAVQWPVSLGAERLHSNEVSPGGSLVVQTSKAAVLHIVPSPRSKELYKVSPCSLAVEEAIIAVKSFSTDKGALSRIAKLVELTRKYEQVSARIESNRILRIPRAYMGGGVRFDIRERTVSGTVPRAMWNEVTREADKQKIAENHWRADFHLWQWGLERLQTALLLHFATSAANVSHSDAAFEPELRRLLAAEGAKEETVSSMISQAKEHCTIFP